MRETSLGEDAETARSGRAWLATISRMELLTAAAERLEELVVRTGAAGLVAVWGTWTGCGALATHRQLPITSLELGFDWPDFDPRREGLAMRPWAVASSNVVSTPVLNWQGEAEAVVTAYVLRHRP